MVQVIKDVVTWLKQWFYTEDEVDTITGGLQTQINNKADSSTVSSLATTVAGKANSTHSHGNLQSDGQVGSTAQASKNVVTDSNGKITTEDKYSHPASHATTMITEASALANIGTNANANQHTINDALNTVIGNLQSIKAIEVVDTKPTASASTMGKLYIVSENSKVNVYYTKQTGTGSSATYSWQKMDTDILDELSVAWNDITNKPFSTVDTAITDGSTNPVTNNAIHDALALKSNSTHGHGNIGNDGKVTTTASSIKKALVTDSNDLVSVVEVDELNCGSFAELQTLINDSHAQETIYLDKDYKNTGSEPAITITNKNRLRIVGNGHTIDADEKSACFVISFLENQAIYFEDLNIINGKIGNGNGGAIKSTNAKVHAVNCNFINNEIRTSGYGGAIASSEMTVKYCTFIDNYAPNSEAIYTNENSIIQDCVFLMAGVYADCQNPLKTINCTYLNAPNTNVTNVNYSKADETLSNTITLVDKGQTNEGCIIFNTIS